MRCSVFDSDSNTPSSSRAPLWLFFFFFFRQRKVYASQECGLVSQRLPHSGYGSDSKQHSIFMLDIILAAGRSATLQPWKTGGFRETVNTAHVGLSQLGISGDECQKNYCN